MITLRRFAVSGDFKDEDVCIKELSRVKPPGSSAVMTYREQHSGDDGGSR